MDVVKTATDWARDEVFSSQFFIFFGILFLLGTVGFWQLGKTELAKAFVVPTLITGLLLLSIGIGLVITNKSRIANFDTAYSNDSSTFIQSEIVRSDKTIKEYQRIVFKVIPFIIIACSLIIVFVDRPNWRASSIAIIAMMVVILLIDSNASVRMDNYKQKLEMIEK